MNDIGTSNKKFKRPKNTTTATTNPETKETRSSHNKCERLEPKCPLLAKDSEWVDILHTSNADTKTNHEEETVLQLVECEEGPETKPLVLMFPALLNEDPLMVEGMLNKAMSTSEVTKHLVGQKANFTFMKKVNRLIPRDKKWLESLTENSTSLCSLVSGIQSDEKVDYRHVSNQAVDIIFIKKNSRNTKGLPSDYEADTEETDNEQDEENNVQIIKLPLSKK